MVVVPIKNNGAFAPGQIDLDVEYGSPWVGIEGMIKRNQHVVPNGGKWSVRSTGASRASGIYETQREAIERARNLARDMQTILYIHGPDGRIRERNSFRTDGLPAKDWLLAAVSFETSIFINCPFDVDYETILQVILFTVTFLGFCPRLATESNNSGDVRLDKIRGLIESSLFSIHDLSRCQAKKKGEHYRLNMPFELGIDYGCRQYYGHGRENKRILILEERPYRYQAAISDLAGCDIQTHEADFQKAVRKVRNWLVSEAHIEAAGATRILGAYADFQEWYFERQLAAGFSEDDIQDYPTKELLNAMKLWLEHGCRSASQQAVQASR
jgi:hypothetical protein